VYFYCLVTQRILVDLYSVVSSINVSTHISCGGITLFILEGGAIPCISPAQVFSPMFAGVHECGCL
jgi:hypothetical protein